MTVSMHPGEFEIHSELVRRLVDTQFPMWANLPLRRIGAGGTDHVIFRLGTELAIRLPRVNGPVVAGSKELTWLPVLARALPVEVPTPVAQGRPDQSYPWFWEIHRWLDGENVPVETIDPIVAAHDLAALVGALHNLSPAGAPQGRGVPLATRDTAVRRWLNQINASDGLIRRWEHALATPPWRGAPVWHHGDLDARNWLVREGRITGVIDWGLMGIGDPACDLMVAWKLHSPAARDAFRKAVPADPSSWERTEGWLLSQAVGILAYYTPENNPTLVDEARHWLDLLEGYSYRSADT